MEQAYLLNTITNALGLSVKKREVLSDDGCDTIYTIIHWNYDNIRECCTTKSKLTTTRGRVSYGDQKIKYLQALEWLVTDLTLRNKQIFLAEFDATTMEDCVDKAKLDYGDGKKYPIIDKPDKLSQTKWVAWEDMVYT